MNPNCHAERGTYEAFHQVVVDGEVYSYALANTLHLRELSFRFLHQMYQEAGLAARHPSRMWYSLSELLPHSATILMLRDSQVVGSISNLQDSPYGMPVCDVQREGVQWRRDAGRRLAEVYSLAIESRARRCVAALAGLYNIITLMNYHVLDTTHLIICVVRDHVRFFRDQLLFRHHHQEQGFHAKTGVECELLTLALDDHIFVSRRDRERSILKHYMPPEQEQQVIEALERQIRPIDSSQFQHFYAIKPELFDSANARQFEYIDYMMEEQRPCQAA